MIARHFASSFDKTSYQIMKRCPFVWLSTHVCPYCKSRTSSHIAQLRNSSGVHEMFDCCAWKVQNRIYVVVRVFLWCFVLVLHLPYRSSAEFWGRPVTWLTPSFLTRFSSLASPTTFCVSCEKKFLIRQHRHSSHQYLSDSVHHFTQHRYLLPRRRCDWRFVRK